MSEMTPEEAGALLNMHVLLNYGTEQTPKLSAIIAAHAQGYAAGRESLVPMTDTEMLSVLNDAFDGEAVRVPPGWREVMRAVERHHGITDALKEIKL